MEHLVAKPTLACTANCRTCTNRRRLYRTLSGRDQLSLGDWQRVFAEAKALGVRHLTISGGEPTLYPQLAELVRAGKTHRWLVRINSNGGFDGAALAEDLLQAGLDVIDISLYSHIPSHHDAMRRSLGLWEKATRNIRLFADLQASHRRFKVISQTILSRENYRDFADLLELNRDLGSSGLLVSYLEGDFEGEHRLSTQQVEAFREEILPRAIDVCRSLGRFTAHSAESSVRKIFSPDILTTENWAGGIYRPVSRSCRIPDTQALVLSNGDVHACNIVEYTHDHVVGNVLARPLKDIWRGHEWNEFRAHSYENCQRCPMAHHVYVPLRSSGAAPAMIKAGLHKLHLDRFENVLLRMRRSRMV